MEPLAPEAQPQLIAPGAPYIRKFTEEKRQEQLALGQRSLYYFMTAICGQVAEDEETGKPTVGKFHQDICAFLEGRAPHLPWNRAVVCCSRGLGKSVAVRMYIAWRCFYIVNFSALVISNSADNAKALYLVKLAQLFQNSRRSEYLRWLYQHRIPDGWEGTTTEQWMLKIDNPNAEPALTVAGIETKIESRHPDLVVLDDPEGADAEKGTAVNDASYAAYQRSIPLLRNPARSQLLVVATPWGARPIVYRLRDQEKWKTEADNETKAIKFFWRPAINDRGESEWPERFPLAYLYTLQKDPIWHTQYMLRRRNLDAPIFNMKDIYESCYKWLTPERDLIQYWGFKFDPDKISEEGYVVPEKTRAVARLNKLRFYIHFDPLHRTPETRRTSPTKMRPSKAAITVVGVNTDYHAFLIKYWTDAKAELHDQAMELFRLYRIYCPFKVTYEAVGAQKWLESHIKTWEGMSPEWSRPKSAGVIFPATLDLPRLSSRLEEGQKITETKEAEFREELGPWVNHGVFHFNREEHEDVLNQLENCLNEDVEVDIINSLAQGPSAWKPPVDDNIVRDFTARRRYVETFVRKAKNWKERTGFSSPWRG